VTRIQKQVDGAYPRLDASVAELRVTAVLKFRDRRVAIDSPIARGILSSIHS
jgi:hypothetical protein